MPIKRPQFVNGEIYHVIMRGVDGRIIFPHKNDCFRFIFNLFMLNNENLISQLYKRHFVGQFIKLMSASEADIKIDKVLGKYLTERSILVDVLTFALVKNHFHLLLRQVEENGISLFMQKLGAGYAIYINKKYERQGHLFQGRFKAVHIQNNDQAQHIFVYVHTNTLGLIQPGWREIGIKDPKKAIKFLENSPLSSYPDYIGVEKFPLVTNREFFLKLLGGTAGCHKFVENWILHKAEIQGYKNIILE